VLRVLLARVWSVVDGLQPHNAVQCAEVSELLHFLAFQSPRAEGGLLCEGACSSFPRGHAAQTSGQRVDAIEPVCSASIGPPPPPKSDERCGRGTPLVVAIRTASGQNASAYLFAIGALFHSKYYAKDAGTKPG